MENTKYIITSGIFNDNDNDNEIIYNFDSLDDLLNYFATNKNIYIALVNSEDEISLISIYLYQINISYFNGKTIEENIIIDNVYRNNFTKHMKYFSYNIDNLIYIVDFIKNNESCYDEFILQRYNNNFHNNLKIYNMFINNVDKNIEFNTIKDLKLQPLKIRSDKNYIIKLIQDNILRRKNNYIRNYHNIYPILSYELRMDKDIIDIFFKYDDDDLFMSSMIPFIPHNFIDNNFEFIKKFIIKYGGKNICKYLNIIFSNKDFTNNLIESIPYVKHYNNIYNNIFSYIDKSLFNDKEFTLLCISKTCAYNLISNYLPESLLVDKDICKLLIEKKRNYKYIVNYCYDKHSKIIKDFVPDIYKNGTILFRKAIYGLYKNRDSMKYDDLINDFKYFPDNVKDNYKIVKYSLMYNGLCLQYASTRLRAEFNIVKYAIKNNGLALEFASDELRNNHEIIELALKSSKGKAFKYILINDYNNIILYLKQYPMIYKYISSSLKENIEIIKILAKSLKLSSCYYTLSSLDREELLSSLSNLAKTNLILCLI